jgi:hypothetical protein
VVQDGAWRAGLRDVSSSLTRGVRLSAGNPHPHRRTAILDPPGQPRNRAHRDHTSLFHLCSERRKTRAESVGTNVGVRRAYSHPDLAVLIRSFSVGPSALFHCRRNSPAHAAERAESQSPPPRYLLYTIVLYAGVRRGVSPSPGVCGQRFAGIDSCTNA